MRLWHIDLIPYLPKSQLLAQWRELNSIYAKQDRHILINYIYDYNRHYLKAYSDKVIAEMRRREIKIRDLSKYDAYFSGMQNGFAVRIRFAIQRTRRRIFTDLLLQSQREIYARAERLRLSDVDKVILFL